MIQLRLYRIVLGVLLVTFILVLTNVVKEELNPDWVGYMNLYEDGAWLADGGRDLGFLTILNLFKLLPGNDYDFFRLALSFYYAAFVFFLAQGNLIQYGKKSSSSVAIFLAIVSFSIIRFSIQIREGIAVTFILFALIFLAKQASSLKDNGFAITKNNVIALVLLWISTTVHSGTLPFLCILLASLALNYVHSRARVLYHKIFLYLKVLSLFLAFIFPVLYSYFFVDFNMYYVSTLDTIEDANLTTGKIIFWLWEGVVIFFIRKKLIVFTKELDDGTPYKIYLQLLATVVLKVLYIVMLLFVLLQYPGPIVAALGRLLNIALSLSVLVLVFNTRASAFVFVLILSSLASQVRVVIEALYSLKLL